MTKLVNKVGLLIKQERLTPERKPKDDSKKSSSEILSELFGAFNADPPKIEDISSKKTKKNKKKHKKEKKKRSRSSSSSSSDNSEYSHKRKKRKKSKTKKRKEPDRSPCSRSCTPPLLLIPHPEPKVKLGTERKKAEDCKKNKEEVSKKIKEENCKKNKEEVCKKIKEEDCKKNKEEVCKKIKEEDCKKNKEEVCKKIKVEDCKKNKEEDCKKTKEEDGKKIKEEVVVATKAVVKSEPTEVEKKENLCIKNEDKNSNDASLIPMPESPKLKDECCDLQIKVEKKSDTNGDSDKSKCKIQIKNLKFSTVFEETVKQAEEEARKKAEKKEEGEYTDSSCGSPKEDAPSFSQFPKSSDPGGILKKQAAAEEIKILEEEKIIAKKACAKLTESSHKSSRKDTEKPKERGKSKEKDSSKSHKRSKSKSKKSRSRSPTRRHKSSRDDTRRRSRSRHRSKSKRSRSRGRLRYPSPRHRDRDRGRRSRSPSGVKLADSEKKRLLEVARRNAINMLKNGAVPAGAAALPPHTRNQVMAAIQSGGKSVDELTDFCKHLSKKEALGELSSVSSNDDGMSENEDTIAFHHPFLVKEKGPIVLNIRGAAPLPIKSTVAPIANKEELRLQFPVSSGSQHREKASEWVPVSPKKDNMQIAKLNSKPAKSDDSPEKPKEPLALPAPPPKSTPAYLNSFTSGSQLSSVPALAAPGPQAYPPDADSPKIDMATIVSQKIAMIRKEQEDNEITSTRGFGWEQSDTALGEFKGSTGAQILTPRELASGTQAWAKKDQLSRAAPVEGGMGMHLLQKMGWTPGQGLGKEGTGTLQPLLLEVKLDTRGLQAKEEVSTRASKGMKSQRISRCRGPAPLIAGGKHPVSLLGEYCSKQKLGPPEYTLCFECGPDHKKNFLFKVKVAGVEYQPAVASANKKQAKADAAQLALQKIGIVT